MLRNASGVPWAFDWYVIALLVAMPIAATAFAETPSNDLASRDWWTYRAASSAAGIKEDDARGDAYYELAYALGRIGEMKSAADSARKVVDTQKAVYALSFVARKYFELGDSDAAASLLNEAQQVAKNANQAANVFICSHLLREYVALGMVDKAKALVDELPVFARESAMREATAAAAQAAEPSLADKETESVDAIRDSLGRLQSRDEKLAVYQKLVERLIAEKKVSEAEYAIGEMLQLIQSEPRDSVSSKFGTYGDESAIVLVKLLYLPVAEELARQGKPAEARRLVDIVTDSVISVPESAAIVKSVGIPSIVVAQVKLGDLSSARETLAKVPEGLGRSRAAGHLAAAFADAGDLKSAKDVAKLITPGIGSGSSLGIAAAALCRAGDGDGATEMIEGMGDLSERGRAYHVAGRELIESGDAATLDAWLDASPSDMARTFGPLGAAEALGQGPAK